MSKILLIAKRDFKSYFTSPIGYIAIGAFVALAGFFFFGILERFFGAYNQFTQTGQGREVSISDGIVRPTFANINLILLFFIPFITARLFAEERKSHTIEILLTSPVSLWHIIFAKFLSALGLVMAMLIGSSVFILVLFVLGNPDPGPVIAGFIGTVLMSSSMIAIGILFSAMTENQIVAGLLSFGSCLLLWIINWFAGTAGSVFGDVLTYLSALQHLGSFVTGVINSSDIIFYLSLSFIALFLTHRVLDSFRWRA